jgi:hypothetical protein
MSGRFIFRQDNGRPAADVSRLEMAGECEINHPDTRETS